MEDTNYPLSYGSICLCFNYDIAKEVINNLLEEDASEFGLYSNMRINPLTNQRNPGYWEYTTCKNRDYQCDSTLDQVLDFLSTRKNALIGIQKSYPSDLYIRLYIYMKENSEMDFPAIRLEQPLLKVLAELDAVIDVELYWE